MNDEMYSSYDLLDILCPMHAVLKETGHVVHAGPTLHKVFADKPLIGARFLERVELRRAHVAYTDTLTGLKNRRAMDHVLERLMQTEQDFALMHLDLDFFKQVNDTMGHAAGDQGLQDFARRILAETRADDLFARTGGYEFVLIFAGLTGRERLTEIATRLIKRLEEPVMNKGQECQVSGSIGATLSCAYEAPDVARMMADSDLAL